MSKFFLTSFAICLGMVSTATAQDPVDIAQRCARRVNQLVQRCDNAAAEATSECVRKINALQNAGREEAAKEVAEQCIRKATQRARNCAAAVESVCDECIDVLLEMGEPQLARRLNNICEDALEHIRTTLQRQKNIIREALAD